MALDARTAAVVRAAAAEDGLVVVLTGAGVSAASGIPTFRGPEGYWTVGSRQYTPTELATQATFGRDPERVWAWYLWRLGVCRGASPNAAHAAVVRLEDALGDRFRLVTQNVDGLHARAGSSRQRTYAVHGDISLMRCAQQCGAPMAAVPSGLEHRERGATLSEEDRTALTCAACGAWMRPHVLWFDEVYDEARYRFDSTLRAAREASLLVTVGTSGATNLPLLAARTAVAAGAALVDVNPEANAFAEMVGQADAGAVVRAPAAEALPALVDVVVGG